MSILITYPRPPRFPRAQAGGGSRRQARDGAVVARVLLRAVRPAALLLPGRARLRQRQGRRAARRYT